MSTFSTTENVLTTVVREFSIETSTVFFPNFETWIFSLELFLLSYLIEYLSKTEKVVFIQAIAYVFENSARKSQ